MAEEISPENQKKQNQEKQLEEKTHVSDSVAVTKESPESKGEKKTDKPNVSSKKNKSKLMYLAVLSFLLIISSALGVSWYGYNAYQKQIITDSNIEKILSQIASQKKYTDKLESELNSTKSSLGKAKGLINTKIQGLEQRQTAQTKRILAMSTTSREDWLLAEVEYLLKLANQRVLIEKSAAGADALLVEADTILAGLEDPDLFSLRQSIANDLAALRLIKKIDVEGIYLQLSALTNSIDLLPARPSRHVIKENLSTVAEQAEKPLEKFKQSFFNFFRSFKNFVRITNHAEAPTPVLVPEMNQYVRQNLQLMIEKSQLALLREQQDIYNAGISQAVSWVNKYYPYTEERQSYIQQLERLKNKDIVQKLPDISGSLELVHAYIEELHNLNGVNPKKSNP